MQQARTDVWLYAFSVVGLTTLIAAGFWLFHVTNNWAANALMFVPGLLAAMFLLKGTEGFKTVGWGFGQPIYWFWGILLPCVLIAVSLSISVGLGYAAKAPSSSAIATLPPLKLALNMILYTLISMPFAFGEELGWRGYAQGNLIRVRPSAGSAAARHHLGLLALADLLRHRRLPGSSSRGTICDDSDRQHPGGHSNGLAVHPV